MRIYASGRGAEHRKTGERETVENTPLWNKYPECYTEDRREAENSCIWKGGKMLENLDFNRFDKIEAKFSICFDYVIDKSYKQTMVFYEFP